MNVLKPIRYLFFILLAFPFLTMMAQDKTSVSITAQATVIDNSGIELVTIKNMDIDVGMAIDGKIYVSAKRDASAAVMMLKGRANANFRVTFPATVKIANSTGTGTLTLYYEMYGYQSDNQSASEPIDAVERNLQISSDSQYYFWVGGRVDTNNARPGNYNGEFTLQIEYI